MASIEISEAEKTYVLHGVQENLRVDGRTREDLRPIQVETDLVTHTSGSSHLRLANTDILVGVKAELDVPLPDHPSEGRIVFSVDCSANATPEFEGRGGENLATEISRLLTHAYSHSKVFDLKQLNVLDGHQCWVLYVDIQILECGGNLFDAVSLAVKSALFSTRIPKVKVTAVDGGEPEMELSDDPFDGSRLQMDQTPVLITLTRIGNHVVVDPTPEEEACSSACLVMGVSSAGRITAVRKTGAGSFHLGTMRDAIKIGTRIGTDIDKALMKILTKEEKLGFNREKFGFLKVK